MKNPLTKLFPKRTPPTVRAEVISGGSAVFTPFSGNAYANDIYRSAVDAIARNAAKLKGTHIIKGGANRTNGDGAINRILQMHYPQDVVFTVNYHPEITEGMIVLYNGKAFKIVFIDNLEGYKRDIKLHCETSNADLSAFLN